MSLSVCLISFNEELNLERTLKAVQSIADEIIIVDSFSTDKTLEIAQKYGALVFQEEWKGFVAQKNSALEKCKNEWILSLDCDEEITLELSQEINRILMITNKFDAYYIPRRTFYLGKLLKYAWQPDKKLRLVKKSSNPRCIGEDVHEELIVDGDKSVLNEYLIHYSYKNLKHHLNKTIEYSKLSANSYFKQCRKFKISNLVLNPIIAFVRLYFINFGFKDGIRGFIAAISSFIGTFLKYAFLWEIEKKDGKID